MLRVFLSLNAVFRSVACCGPLWARSLNFVFEARRSLQIS